jgi:hypothetical protein
MAVSGPAFAVGNGTVRSTALALTDAPFSFTAAQLANANTVIVTANANAVVMLSDGTAPTATKGIHIAASSNYQVDGKNNIANMQLIRSASDATVTVVLYA